MEQNRFFLNKKVNIYTNELGNLSKDFFRQGVVLEISDDGLMLDDRKDGVIFLSFDKIKKIQEARE